MSLSSLFPPVQDAACPSLLQSMESKDAPAHPVSMPPAEAHPFPPHIPSDSCSPSSLDVSTHHSYKAAHIPLSCLSSVHMLLLSSL